MITNLNDVKTIDYKPAFPNRMCWIENTAKV